MSDKKNLLNESQIRQFMKLASLTPLAPGFVKGLTERTADEIEESHGRGRNEGAAGYGSPDAHSRLEEEAPPGEELDFAADDLEGGSPEEDAEAAVDIEKADDEMGLDDAEPEGRMISVDDFLSALESALEGVMGDEVEIDSDEMADEEEVEVADVDMADDAMDMDVAVEDEEMLQEEEGSKWKDGEHEYKRRDKKGKVGKRAGDVKGPDGKMHYKTGETNESTEATDDIVEAVTKRVAARILKSALAKK